MPLPERPLRAGPIARVALALLLGATVGYLGRAAQERPAPSPAQPPPPALVAPPARPEPVLPLPPPVVTRRDLLAAVAAAADAHGSGAEPPKELADLVGRRFEIRLPMTCPGGPAASAALVVETIPARKTLRLRARPESWSDAPWFKMLAGDAVFDAAEGFWIPRPWTASAACPGLSAQGDTPTAAPGTVGLVQLFEPDGARTMRRGERPYEHTERADEPGAPPGAYRLLLAGRIAQFAEGQPVRCHAASPNQRPVCMIAVAFDHVAFEDAQGAPLAEWRG